MPEETVVNARDRTKEKMTDTSSGRCSSAWLAEQLDCSAEVVLLDCRSACDFNSSHVDMAIHIALPSIMLRRLKNGSLNVASVINCNEAKERLLNSYKTGTVVIYDECTSDVNANPSSVVSVLRRKLREDGCRRVLLLEGGFAAFCEQFPEQCAGIKESESTIMGLSNLRISDTTDVITTPTSGSTPGSGDSPFPVEVLPYLFLGNAKNSADLECLYKNRITHIINVTQDVPNTFERHDNFKYLQIAITDHWSQNLSAFFPKAFAFIDEARDHKSGVLVHCLAGISRSVTVTVAYLMYTLSLSLNDAYDFVKRCKPNISPNFNFMGQLLDFEKTLARNRTTCECPVDMYQQCSCREITTYFSTPNFTLPSSGVVLPVEATTQP